LAAVAAAEDIGDILATAIPTHSGRLPFHPDGPVAIGFERVSFSYANEKPALREVSFEAKAGEHVAIVGPSGAGKTTLMNLLLGFVRADKGRLIANGQPLAEFALDNWRRHIAWLPQRAHLFAGTVADNIALGLADISRD